MTEYEENIIGRYQVQKKLGEGWLADVYLARDKRLDREVAIKFLNGNLISPELMGQILNRFERVMQAQAKLEHPNVIYVLDSGWHESKPFLVMPYLSGGSFYDVVNLPVDFPEALEIILKIVPALEYAHREEVIHGGLKPSNLFFDKDGEVKVSDFGMVSLLNGNQINIMGSSGSVAGALEYVSPQQGLGSPLDSSMDIYSLGVIFFELLTGGRPYQAETLVELVVKQKTEPLLLPSQLVEGLNGDVDRVIQKAMCVSGEEGYADIQAFIADLEMLKNSGENDRRIEAQIGSSQIIQIEGFDKKAAIELSHGNPKSDVIKDKESIASNDSLIPQIWDRPGTKELERKKIRKQFGGVILGIVVLIVLIAFSIIKTVINGTQGVGILSGLATDTPTVTPEATATLSLSATPTPTITPTIMPTSFNPGLSGYTKLEAGFGDSSIFNFGNQYWELGVDEGQIYLENNDSADPIWQEKMEPCENDSGEDVECLQFKYTQYPGGGITWTMDNPFVEGYYEVFVPDTVEHSKGIISYQVNLTLDGQSESSIEINRWVKFEDANDEVNWISLGVFNVNNGEIMQVKLDIPADSDENSVELAADRLVIVQLDDGDKEIMRRLETKLTEKGYSNYEIVAVMDDMNAEFTGSDDWELNVEGSVENIAWHKEYTYRGDELSDEREINWRSPIYDLEGDYLAFVYIQDDYFEAAADYEVLIFSEEREIGVAPPFLIEQSQNKGEWILIGNSSIEFKADPSVPGNEDIGFYNGGIRMKVKPNPAVTSPESPRIGVDAVVIVKIIE
ncbi:MAG: serine/threonine protein kinase [Anaerolineaceae bacterium]|nr:serine/threonine protein kinase [Anaerolineaceae bacterium]